MAAVFNLIVFISCAVNAVGFLLIHENIQRNVTKILTVPNGGPWGTWTTKEFCAAGSYAIGYNMKASVYTSISRITSAIVLKRSILK
jgi:hypothetical protein